MNGFELPSMLLRLVVVNNLKAKYFSSFEFQKAPQLILNHKGFYQKTFLSEKLLNMDVLINDL